MTSMNLIELQEQMKSKDMAELIAISQSGKVPDNIIALGEISRQNEDKQRMLAMQAKPDETIADRVIGRGLASLMPQMPQIGAPQGPQMQQQAPMAAQAPMAPTPMKDGGAIRMRDGRGIGDIMEIVGQLSETYPAPDMMALMQQAEGFFPDTLAPIRERLARYEAEEPRRRQMDITNLLLSIGTGIASGKSPSFLSNLAGGGQGALQALQQMQTRRQGEERFGLENALSMASAEMQRRGAITGLGSRMYEQTSGRQRDLMKTSSDLYNSELNRRNSELIARIQAGATIKAQEFHLLTTMMTQAQTMSTQLLAQGTQLLDSTDPKKQEQGREMIVNARYWEGRANETREAAGRVSPLGINFPEIPREAVSMGEDNVVRPLNPYAAAFGIPEIGGTDPMPGQPGGLSSVPGAARGTAPGAAMPPAANRTQVPGVGPSGLTNLFEQGHTNFDASIEFFLQRRANDLMQDIQRAASSGNERRADRLADKLSEVQQQLEILRMHRGEREPSSGDERGLYPTEGRTNINSPRSDYSVTLEGQNRVIRGREP